MWCINTMVTLLSCLLPWSSLYAAHTPRDQKAACRVCYGMNTHMLETAIQESWTHCSYSGSERHVVASACESQMLSSPHQALLKTATSINTYSGKKFLLSDCASGTYKCICPGFLTKLPNQHLCWRNSWYLKQCGFLNIVTLHLLKST